MKGRDGHQSFCSCSQLAIRVSIRIIVVIAERLAPLLCLFRSAFAECPLLSVTFISEKTERA